MASTFISRTFSGTYNKGTISMWLKRSGLGSQYIFYNESASDSNDYALIQFDSSDRIEFMTVTNGTHTQKLITNRVFRDTSAFYHFVFAMDTDNSTADNRLRIYVNGVEETSYNTRDNGSQGDTNYMFQTSATNKHRMFASSGGSACFDGLATHIHIVPNSQLAPTVFGETDSTSGIWKPKTAPSVTYTAQGAFLKFENSGNLDLDSSGNNLTFTTSGTLTQNVDSPSNVFATLNPLQQNNTATTYSNGNLKGTGTASTSNFSSTPATLAVSVGKWYAEYKPNLSSTGSSISGFVNLDTANFNATDYYGGSNNMSAGLYDDAGQILYSTGTNLGSVGALSNGDIVMLAMDLDNGYLYWGKNGTWFNSANPATSGGTGGLALSNLGSNGTYTFLNGNRKSMGTEWNFGSGFFGTTAVASANADGNGFGAFEYAVPSGYYALCTKNIKEFG